MANTCESAPQCQIGVAENAEAEGLLRAAHRDNEPHLLLTLAHGGPREYGRNEQPDDQSDILKAPALHLLSIDAHLDPRNLSATSQHMVAAVRRSKCMPERLCCFTRLFHCACGWSRVLGEVLLRLWPRNPPIGSPVATKRRAVGL